MFVLLALTGCASAQRPVQFQTTNPVRASVAAAARELNNQGFRATTVDAESGVIHTAWADTGVLFGKIAGWPATLVKRYTVTVRSQDGIRSVEVRADMRRCMLGLGALEDSAPCEEYDIQLGGDQEALDRIGAGIRRALQ